MSDVLTGDIELKIGTRLRDTLADGTINDWKPALTFLHTITDGVAVDLMDKVWFNTGTLGATTNLDLDVAGGLTKSIFGTSVDVSFAKVKLIVVVNLSTTTSLPLLVGPNATGTPLTTSFLGPFNAVNTSVLSVGPNSPLVLANFKDGWAIAAGTTDILRIRNGNASAVDYKVLIAGTSA